MNPKKHPNPTGPFYCVLFPAGWEIRSQTNEASEGGFIGHPDLWPKIAEELGTAWAPQLGYGKAVLRDLLIPHTYGFPRGRALRPEERKNTLIVWGEEAIVAKHKKTVEVAFNCVKKAKWEPDEHEQCQVMDKSALRDILCIKEDWPAVSVDYGWD